MVITHVPLFQIKLDVGGQTFATSKTTLLAHENSFFYAMLSSGDWQPDEDGSYFIDRNPQLFPLILDFMRHDVIDLEGFSEKQLEAVRVEADYYRLDKLHALVMDSI